MRVVVNAAMSADGKIASRKRTQLEISGDEDFRRVDELRAEVDAVLVGVGTVLADDPSLTLDSEQLQADREERGEPKNPARVVADSHVRSRPTARIFNDRAETYLLVSEAAPSDFVTEMEEAGATVITAGENRVELAPALEELEDHGIDELLVEGGGEIIFSLFEAGLVDRLSVFVGSLVIGGRDAPTLADGDGFTSDFPELTLTEVERLDDGVALHYDVP